MRPGPAMSTQNARRIFATDGGTSTSADRSLWRASTMVADVSERRFGVRFPVAAGRFFARLPLVVQRFEVVGSPHRALGRSLSCWRAVSGIGVDLDARSTLQDGLMTTPPVIRIAGLMKSFGDVEVLRGLDLDIARGSIFALLGSNGVGKTTVVKILSTLLKADAGSALVNGFDPFDQWPHKVWKFPRPGPKGLHVT